MATQTVDLAGLLASPSAWLNLLADAVARGDHDRAQECLDRLTAMGWIVIPPEGVTRTPGRDDEPGVSPDDLADPPAPEGPPLDPEPAA
jgi:hypothetical protein